MNYAKFVAEGLWMKRSRRRRCVLDQMESLLDEATRIQNRIVESNLRLVVSIAKHFADSTAPLDERVSEAILPLIRAVELFDISRGYCFSTYATNALRNVFLRSRARAARRSSHQIDAAVLETLADSRPTVTHFEALSASRKAFTANLLRRLSDREQKILAARFGLGDYNHDHTFQEIGRLLKLSKERVRVIANRAIEKLREAVHHKEWPDADGEFPMNFI